MVRVAGGIKGPCRKGLRMQFSRKRLGMGRQPTGRSLLRVDSLLCVRFSCEVGRSMWTFSFMTIQVILLPVPKVTTRIHRYLLNNPTRFFFNFHHVHMTDHSVTKTSISGCMESLSAVNVLRIVRRIRRTMTNTYS